MLVLSYTTVYMLDLNFYTFMCNIFYIINLLHNGVVEGCDTYRVCPVRTLVRNVRTTCIRSPFVIAVAINSSPRYNVQRRTYVLTELVL